MISAYDAFMRSFEKGTLGVKRADLLKSASGHVLEIGSGTGVNLAHYDFNQISAIVFSDKKIDSTLVKRLEMTQIQHELVTFDVEMIPYEDETFDTIVVTLVFCSVANVQKGLAEIKRVLKNDGQLIFIEHVLPEKRHLKPVFNVLTPVWKHIAGGCHLNRDFIGALESAGFSISERSRFNKTAFVSGKAYKTKNSENEI